MLYLDATVLKEFPKSLQIWLKTQTTLLLLVQKTLYSAMWMTKASITSNPKLASTSSQCSLTTKEVEPFK